MNGADLREILHALCQATLAVTGELTLDNVLQQIADSARRLASAQYAAIGVPNADGNLEMFVHSGMRAADVAQIPHYPKGRGLLGALVREQKSIRIPEIAADPLSYGFPQGHPLMSSFLGVPILAGHTSLGNLYLTNKQGAATFTETDQQLVEMLAAHAAVAIQNARLYEQVGRLAILEERTRIGMDLHDGVIQSIYAVGLVLESAKFSLNEHPDDSRELLEVAASGLSDAIHDIRNFILDLRPQHFSGDLRQGLGRLVREFQANTMVRVTMAQLPIAVGHRVPTAVARALFLTTQGALANIARHARASHVTVDVSRTDTAVTLTIADDGSGFDVKTVRQTIGHGLANMRERAEELKGTFTIESMPGEGTTLILTLPWEQ